MFSAGQDDCMGSQLDEGTIQFLNRTKKIIAGVQMTCQLPGQCRREDYEGIHGIGR
jgi:hypothetical protein